MGVVIWGTHPGDTGEGVGEGCRSINVPAVLSVTQFHSGTSVPHGATISVRHARRNPPTVYSPAEAGPCASVTASRVGAERVKRELEPAKGSEDFA